MRFELSEEQSAIVDMMSSYLADRWSSEPRREGIDQPPAVIPEKLWREIIEMGFLGISVSERAGGGGEALLTSALIAEVAGGALLPGPLVTSLAASLALDHFGAPGDLLSAVISGEIRVTLALEEPNGTWGPENMLIEPTLDGEGGSVSGTKILVPDADRADIFLVAVNLPEGHALLRLQAGTDGLSINPMRRIDGQSVAELVMENVSFRTADILRGKVNSEDALQHVYDIWTLLVSADLLGISQAVLNMTTDYAKERTQFGRQIGSFQAVSHRLADIQVEVEIGRSLLYGACLALQERQPDAGALVSAAKAWMSDMAVAAAEAGLQLHGGIGYTWELDIHLYLRQARANAVTLGDASYHRSRAADYLVNLYGSPG